jgi:uncharacterized protein
MARGFPVIAITGPRQSGKSTLARETFPLHPYVTLEDTDTRSIALADPRRFLARFPEGAVFDEVQRAPELLSYLQGRVDAAQRPGEFIVTGSQQFGLMDGITQSLAGRAGLLQLLPLSHTELRQSASAGASLEEAMWRGGYPALHAQFRDLPPQTWFASYVATYLERDVRQVLNISNLALFQRFVLMCAARSGQLLNLNSLAADCGISQPTARQWLTVLQASYVLTLLPPYHRNFGKRLVKTPKLYFLDTGLLCHLLRIPDALALQTHAMRGAIFETWVVTEVIKHRYNQGLSADLYFWRDNHGTEVDLVFEDAGRLQAVEIKSGTTFVMDWLGSARRWKTMVGVDAAQPIVLYGGAESFDLADAQVVSWRGLGLTRAAPAQPPSTRKISRP